MFKQEIHGHDPSAFSCTTHVLIICEVNRIGSGITHRGSGVMVIHLLTNSCCTNVLVTISCSSSCSSVSRFHNSFSEESRTYSDDPAAVFQIKLRWIFGL
jgi:hypothetical protein